MAEEPIPKMPLEKCRELIQQHFHQIDKLVSLKDKVAAYHKASCLLSETALALSTYIEDPEIYRLTDNIITGYYLIAERMELALTSTQNPIPKKMPNKRRSPHKQNKRS